MHKEERVPKLIKFPVDLVTRIEKYKTDNELNTFAQAVYQLIRIGLDSKEN